MKNNGGLRERFAEGNHPYEDLKEMAENAVMFGRHKTGSVIERDFIGGSVNGEDFLDAKSLRGSCFHGVSTVGTKFPAAEMLGANFSLSKNFDETLIYYTAGKGQALLISNLDIQVQQHGKSAGYITFDVSKSEKLPHGVKRFDSPGGEHFTSKGEIVDPDADFVDAHDVLEFIMADAFLNHLLPAEHPYLLPAGDIFWNDQNRWVLELREELKIPVIAMPSLGH